MFGLADIQFDIFWFSVLSDDHAAVDFLSWFDEQGSSVLGGEQTVGDSLTCFECNEGALLAVVDIAFVRAIAVVSGVQDSVALGYSEEFAPKSDEASGGYVEFQAVGTVSCQAHALQFPFSLAEFADN